MANVKTGRWKLLKQLEHLMEAPLVVLGFAWLILLVLELIWGTNPVLNILSTSIWVVFIVDFILKFIIAPEKGKYLKTNVITMISLVVPAFRLLRLFRHLRFFRLSRGVRLLKVIGSLNRGIRSLSRTMKRRAFGYVVTLTLI